MSDETANDLSTPEESSLLPPLEETQQQESAQEQAAPFLVEEPDPPADVAPDTAGPIADPTVESPAGEPTVESINDTPEEEVSQALEPSFLSNQAPTQEGPAGLSSNTLTTQQYQSVFSYWTTGSTPTYPTTTVASASNGGELSAIASWSGGTLTAGVLAVASTSGFAPSGSLYVATSSTTGLITYTGITASTFTGCAYVSGSATGTVATGGSVTSTNPVAYASQTNINGWSNGLLLQTGQYPTAFKGC